MIGLDYVMAGYVHLVSGQIKCNTPKLPQISVVATDTTVRYDHTKTQKQLDKFETDTVSPYGGEVRSHVGGLMKGEVSVSQTIRFYQETYPHLRTGCLSVGSIKVNINIKPTIYIASDYPRNSCMYNAVLEHEKKHVAVDQQMVAKYKGLITQALHDAIQKSGHQRGPFSTSLMESEQLKLQNYIQGVIKAYSDKLTKERREKQQAVDTLEEYERVQAQCRKPILR